jgi:hypothetical protein
MAAQTGVTTATGSALTYYNQALPIIEESQLHYTRGHKAPVELLICGSTNTALDPSIPTLPNVLVMHHTAFLGKWHLSGHGVPNCQPAPYGFGKLDFFDTSASRYFN